MDQKLLDQIPTPQEMQARPSIVTTAEELLTSILRVMNRPLKRFGSLRVPIKYTPSDSTLLEVLNAFQSRGYTAYYVRNEIFIQWDTGDTYTLTEEDFVEVFWGSLENFRATRERAVAKDVRFSVDENCAFVINREAEHPSDFFRLPITGRVGGRTDLVGQVDDIPVYTGNVPKGTIRIVLREQMEAPDITPDMIWIQYRHIDDECKGLLPGWRRTPLDQADTLDLPYVPDTQVKKLDKILKQAIELLDVEPGCGTWESENPDLAKFMSINGYYAPKEESE